MGAWCVLTTLLLALLAEGQEETPVAEHRCSSRVKRYALEGSRWRVDELTYRIDKYSTKLPKKTVDKILRQAFDLWEEVTNLKFTEKKSGKVHIGIKFEKGAHGDDADFDGPGGYRAHAFFPGYGGDAHFDDDENWTVDSSGTQLLLIATHELGHALGLGHSNDPNALMAPSHKEWKGPVKPNKDDIKAIQALYGAPGEPRPEKGDPALGRGSGPNNPGFPGIGQPGSRPGFRPGPGPGPGGFVPRGPGFNPGDPLGDPFHDHRHPDPFHPPLAPQPAPRPAPTRRPRTTKRPRRTTRRPRTTTQSTLTYDYDYYEDEYESEFLEDADEVIENTISAFTPDNRNKDLCKDGKVDTTLTMKDGGTYVFRRSKYWKLTDTGVAEGYPRQISDDWEGLPNNLDAAFSWKNGKTYFLKGSRYWRYSPESFGKLDRGFPKDISKGFEGIPNNIDAAFVWAKNDKIYFFKGSNYWKFDPRKDPPVAETYPRPLSNWEGVPNSIDAALRYSNDNTYFFKDGEYYRFNEDTFTVDTDGPAYPRASTTWWFGCQSASEKQTEREEKKNVRFILD